MRSRHPGEGVVLYLISLNQRHCAAFLLLLTDTDRQTRHRTEVNDGKPVPALRSPCRLLASPIAHLVVHSPHRLLARCSAQAGRWISASRAPRPPRPVNNDAIARWHLLPDHTQCLSPWCFHLSPIWAGTVYLQLQERSRSSG